MLHCKLPLVRAADPRSHHLFGLCTSVPLAGQRKAKLGVFGPPIGMKTAHWLRLSKDEIHAFGVIPNVRRNISTKALG